MIEVVVVGAGIAGVSAALALAERGAAVNVVDRTRPAGAATGASGGMLAPQYESPGFGPLYRLGVRSRAAWPAFARRLESLSGRPVPVRSDGMLVANWTAGEEDASRAAVSWQRDHGQRADILSPDEAAELQNGLARDARSWLWLPDEGRVDAQGLAQVFADALSAAGVRLITGARVRELATTGQDVRGVVLEDGRTLSADRVVLAAGAWTQQVAGETHRIPVRPVRGQMLRFAGGSPPLTRLVASHDGRYLVPRPDATILAGSTMEEAGFDRSLTEEGTRAIHDDAGRLFPPLAGRKTVERWADLRPMPSDGLPILGRDPVLRGLVYATGYGRNGILLGPITGEVVAEVTLDRSPAETLGLPAEDIEAIRPDRFT